MTISSLHREYDFDKEQLLAKRQSAFPKVTGIYFLIKDTDIVYVGQSVDVYARVAQHSRDAFKAFDTFVVLECPPEYLTDLEAHYIYKFRSPLNTSLPSNDRYKSFHQIKKILGVPAPVLKLWLRYKGIDYDRDGYYQLDDFMDFADFKEWMRKRYPNVHVDQCSTDYLREYIKSISSR